MSQRFIIDIVDLFFLVNIDYNLSPSPSIGDRHTVCVLNELNMFSWAMRVEMFNSLN